MHRLSTIARRLAATPETPVAPALLIQALAGEILDDLPDFDQSDADLQAEAARAVAARDTLLSVAPAAAESGVVLL